MTWLNTARTLLARIIELWAWIRSFGLRRLAAGSDFGYTSRTDRGSRESYRGPFQPVFTDRFHRELDDAARALARGGNVAAQRLFHELMVSHQIYIKNRQGVPESNSQRAGLLKESLRHDLERTALARKKVLVKFGDWHLYKGLNPLHQRDLGNYTADWPMGKEASRSTFAFSAPKALIADVLAMIGKQS